MSLSWSYRTLVVVLGVSDYASNPTTFLFFWRPSLDRPSLSGAPMSARAARFEERSFAMQAAVSGSKPGGGFAPVVYLEKRPWSFFFGSVAIWLLIFVSNRTNVSPHISTLTRKFCVAWLRAALDSTASLFFLVSSGYPAYNVQFWRDCRRSRYF